MQIASGIDTIGYDDKDVRVLLCEVGGSFDEFADVLLACWAVGGAHEVHVGAPGGADRRGRGVSSASSAPSSVSCRIRLRR